MSERFDVIVVGSGAGGGVVAGELAERGRSVLLLEAGPHLTAADFERWESKAGHDMWWPLRFAFPAGEPNRGPVVMIGGRCVGGTTTINTNVALRASQRELDKWHAASELVNDRGEPLNTADLAPHYERVERYLGVRDRIDWDRRRCVRTARRGFEALGASLEPLPVYADHNCMQCGSCLQGCPTNASKSTLNTYIHRNWRKGNLELRAECSVERVVVEDGQATGVRYTGPGGETHQANAGAVVVAGGALNTPQILLRSGLTNPMIGRNLGFHPAQFAYGLFEEPQDCHVVAPITAHCHDFAADDAGGFVVEAVTVQDPIGFAVALCDEDGPMWGESLVEAARRYRYWVGLLNLSNDDNHGRVVVEDGVERFECDFQSHEFERMDRSLDLSRRVLEAAGATRILWSSLASTHVQGTCRMGSDPATSVVDGHGESHEVKRLFVGDASLFPRTLSVNPSLTIMALASRLAEHLDADAAGYLSPKRELVA